MASRSASAGCTISAASTPSNAPPSMSGTLPPPPSSAGRADHHHPPTELVGEGRRRQPRPRPAAAMTLCPQAWPMPGSASYSHTHRHGRPLAAGRGLERRLDATGRPGDVEAGVLEHAGEQLVGEALLVVELRVGVDLVRHVDQQLGPAVDLGGEPLLGVAERGRLHRRHASGHLVRRRRAGNGRTSRSRRVVPHPLAELARACQLGIEVERLDRRHHRASVGRERGVELHDGLAHQHLDQAVRTRSYGWAVAERAGARTVCPSYCRARTSTGSRYTSGSRGSPEPRRRRPRRSPAAVREVEQELVRRPRSPSPRPRRRRDGVDCRDHVGRRAPPSGRAASTVVRTAATSLRRPTVCRRPRRRGRRRRCRPPSRRTTPPRGTSRSRR